jgi:hypothetical protein
MVVLEFSPRSSPYIVECLKLWDEGDPVLGDEYRVSLFTAGRVEILRYMALYPELTIALVSGSEICNVLHNTNTDPHLFKEIERYRNALMIYAHMYRVIFSPPSRDGYRRYLQDTELLTTYLPSIACIRHLLPSDNPST